MNLKKLVLVETDGNDASVRTKELRALEIQYHAVTWVPDSQ